MPRLAAVFLLFSLWASPVAAAGFEDKIIASLEAQGYAIVEHGFTFLGRLRVVAESADYHRELVFNPGTGEILRDYAVPLQVFLASQERDDNDNSSATSQPTVAATAAPDKATQNSGESPLEGTFIIPEPVLP